MFILSLILFFTTFVYIIKTFLTVLLKYFKTNKNHQKQLEKEGKINGYIEYLNFIKDRNPWGGFVSPETMKRNLILENDSEESKLLVYKMVEDFIKFRKQMIVCFILILSTMVSIYLSSIS